MATQADVRRIALALPEVVEHSDRFAFSVPNKGKLKGIAWVWLERIAPKKARVPQPRVLAVRVPNLIEKDFLLKADADKFFTEPHYDGYPAVLVRLDAVTPKQLEPLIHEAWRCQAPKQLLQRHAQPPRTPRPRKRPAQPPRKARPRNRPAP